MNDKDENGVDLEFLKQLNEAEIIPPSYDLLSRIMSDADNASKALQRRDVVASYSLLEIAKSWIGGWPGFAIITAASVLGLWVGLNLPTHVEKVTPAYIAAILHGHDDFDLFFHHDTFVADDEI